MFWVLLIGGIAGLFFGTMMILGGGMSDAPSEGDATAKGGLITFVVSGIILIFACVARHHGWLPV